MAEIMARKRYSVKNIAKGTKKIKVQSDWNQNDSTQPDYIKNRFGGYEDIISGEELIVTEERPFADDGTSAGGYTYYYSIEEAAAMSSLGGAGIKVIWDGETYEFDSPTTQLSPTYYRYTQDGVFEFDTSSRVIAYDTDSSHIFGVFKLDEIGIVPIPEKYLPDTIATKDYVDSKGSSSEQIQADWLQNDSTQPDYIKNRIGGYEETSYTISSYMEEITCEFESVEEENYKYKHIFTDFTSSVFYGATLEIVWDGIPYLCPCLDGYYGNTSLIDSARTDHNNEPFVLFYIYPDPDSNIIVTNDEGSHTVAVNIAEDYEEIITKIPEKYLELDNYVRTENLPEQVQVDWLENNSAKKSYIKNRFGGYEDYERTAILLDETEYTFTDNKIEIKLPSTAYVMEFIVDGISHIGTEDVSGNYTVSYNGTSDDGTTSIYYVVNDHELIITGFEGDTHTVKINALSDEPVAVPIPEKYLPDTVATKEYVDNNTPKQVQPDWSQNDETQPDYIKNRICYSEVSDEEETILERASRTFTLIDEEMSVYQYNFTDEEKEILSDLEGESGILRFTIDDRIYDSSIDNISEDMNVNLCFERINDTKTDNFNMSYGSITTQFYSTNDISLAFISENVVKLPEKYLPDTIVTKTYVDEAITTAINNITNGDEVSY